MLESELPVASVQLSGEMADESTSASLVANGALVLLCKSIKRSSRPPTNTQRLCHLEILLIEFESEQ